MIRRASRSDMLRMIGRISRREGKGATLEQLRVAMELDKKPSAQVQRLKLGGYVDVTYERGIDKGSDQALVTLTAEGVALIGGAQ
jgi:hypothetical protein